MSFNAAVLAIKEGSTVQRCEESPSYVSWLGKQIQTGCVNLTSSKAQIIFSWVVSGACAASAAILAGLALGGILATPVGWAAIPLCLIGGVAFIYSFQITDYDNAQVVEAFRKEAEKLPLDDIVKKHGWEKMFRYGIPVPERFEAVYREKMGTLTLKAMFGYYETVESESRKNLLFQPFNYTIPHPSEWRAKWAVETASLSCCDIIDSYSIAELEKYRILPEAELQMLKNLEIRRAAALREHKQHVEEISSEYNRNIAPFLRTLQAALAAAEREFKASWGPGRLQQINDQYKQDIEKIEAERNAKISEAKRQFLAFQESTRIAGSATSSEEYERQRLQQLETIKRAETAALAAIQAAQENFTRKRQAFSQEIQQADDQKKRACQVVRDRFNHDTTAYRQLRDARLRVEETSYARQKEMIDIDYRRFLATGTS